jgi:TRAP-type C4-dicarboxylate transport system permease small subunit
VSLIRRTDRALEWLVRLAAGTALAASSAAMFAQVIARFVFSAPFVWAEEFAVLMFAWITLVGAAAVQADDSHLSIDTLRTQLPPHGRRWLDALRRVTIAACCLVLIWQGIALSARMWTLEFPAMGVSRSLLYLSVPVGFAFSLWFALRTLVRRVPPVADDSVSG